MSHIHKNTQIYTVFLIEILIKELDKFGLELDKDCILGRYVYEPNNLEVLKFNSNFSNYVLVLYICNISPTDIIEHRHKIKVFVKEVYESKLKRNINTPINNAVGWKV